MVLKVINTYNIQALFTTLCDFLIYEYCPVLNHIKIWGELGHANIQNLKEIYTCTSKINLRVKYQTLLDLLLNVSFTKYDASKI